MGALTSFGLLPSLFSVFVETGTYTGITTREAAKHFRTVHTIELDQAIFEKARRDLAEFKNINFLRGDSARMLGGLCAIINEPAIFYLDAHYAGGPTARGDKEVPLYDEIAQIAQRPFQDLIIVDDFQLFGKQGTSGTDGTIYPVMQYDWRDITLEGLFGALRKHNRVAWHKIKSDMVYLLLAPRSADLISVL